MLINNLRQINVYQPTGWQTSKTLFINKEALVPMTFPSLKYIP